jgi:DNA-binding MarR family transcriptional regulator
MTIAASDTRRTARRMGPSSTSKERLRLWLRLLRSARGIEAELRERLRVTYDITLPQFDVLAALARRAEGVTMTELSRYLMVSNGNVTGIIARLVADGLVVRKPVPLDRRATVVQLTEKGRAAFAAMAEVHEGWVNELLGDFGKAEAIGMTERLDVLVGQLRQREPQANGGKAR